MEGRGCAISASLSSASSSANSSSAHSILCAAESRPGGAGTGPVGIAAGTGFTVSRKAHSWSSSGNSSSLSSAGRNSGPSKAAAACGGASASGWSSASTSPVVRLGSSSFSLASFAGSPDLAFLLDFVPAFSSRQVLSASYESWQVPSQSAGDRPQPLSFPKTITSGGRLNSHFALVT
jgi:hypothetical protein